MIYVDFCLSFSQVMERGTNASDWIRNGEEEGEVEIDLSQSNRPSGVVTIRRQMFRSEVSALHAAIYCCYRCMNE